MTNESMKYIEIVLGGETLSQDQMRHCMEEIMEGVWKDEALESFLRALAKRGETVEEITGAARVMRAKALPIKAPEGAIDCCGTGGDCSGTYNISTTVALVCAACGVPVAKHGNRSASSKSGAADVLEALGVDLSVSQEKLEEALKKFHYAFLMAPHHHSAMNHVMPVRKKMKTRTIFNILGPLANPANTQYQLLGVFDKALVLPIAQVLKNLGTRSAWVVHGSDGLDEITTTGKTYVARLKNSEITQSILTPSDFGIRRAAPEELKGGSPQENAAALRDVLDGAQNAYRDIVLANAASALVVAEKEETLEDALWHASHAIDSGKAMDLLESYIAFTKQNSQSVA
ncbi:MAG: anthranilate phosphoribosyltransferase [Alphaproteobacteria bacterium]